MRKENRLISLSQIKFTKLINDKLLVLIAQKIKKQCLHFKLYHIMAVNVIFNRIIVVVVVIILVTCS